MAAIVGTRGTIWRGAHVNAGMRAFQCQRSPPHHESGDGVLKPRRHYTEKNAFNALSDLPALDLLIAAGTDFPDKRVPRKAPATEDGAQRLFAACGGWLCPRGGATGRSVHQVFRRLHRRRHACLAPAGGPAAGVLGHGRLARSAGRSRRGLGERRSARRGCGLATGLCRCALRGILSYRARIFHRRVAASVTARRHLQVANEGSSHHFRGTVAALRSDALERACACLEVAACAVQADLLQAASRRKTCGAFIEARERARGHVDHLRQSGDVEFLVQMGRDPAMQRGDARVRSGRVDRTTGGTYHAVATPVRPGQARCKRGASVLRDPRQRLVHALTRFNDAPVARFRPGLEQGRFPSAVARCRMSSPLRNTDPRRPRQQCLGPLHGTAAQMPSVVVEPFAQPWQACRSIRVRIEFATDEEGARTADELTRDGARCHCHAAGTQDGAFPCRGQSHVVTGNPVACSGRSLGGREHGAQRHDIDKKESGKQQEPNLVRHVEPTCW